MSCPGLWDRDSQMYATMQGKVFSPLPLAPSVETKSVSSPCCKSHRQRPFSSTSLSSMALSKGKWYNEAPHSSASISICWQLSLNNNLSQQILHQEINGPYAGLILL